MPAKKKEFEKPKNRRNKLLKAGAVNRTDTSFTAKTLLLDRQNLQKAHLVGKSTSGGDVFEPKEWRAQVRLACSHSSHHSGKARLDAVHRLKALLKRPSGDDTSVFCLVVEAALKGLMNDSKECRKAWTDLVPFLWAIDAQKIEQALLLALSHIRSDIRSTARDALKNLVDAKAKLKPFKLTESLISFMPDLNSSERKHLELLQLIVRFLELIYPQEATCNFLEYEWEPVQAQPLLIIKRTVHSEERLSSVAIETLLARTKEIRSEDNRVGRQLSKVLERAGIKEDLCHSTKRHRQ